MLHLSASCRYFYYNGMADMRKGAYSLSGLVRNQIQQCIFQTMLTPSFRSKLTPLFRTKLTPLFCK
jgi:hypothetical protein